MSYKILIIDDNVSLLKALHRHLNVDDYDFEIITAQDSYQGLSQATSQNPDVIVLDVNMPAGGGFSVHERLIKLNKTNVPIIYITGEDSPRVNETTTNLGAFSVIQKPFEIGELVDTIMLALKEHQTT